MPDSTFKITVRDHQNAVRAFVNTGIGELWRRYLEHDRSKLEPPELQIFEKNHAALKGSEYGTTAYFEMLAKVGSAVTHHYQHNRHHPEHFTNGVDDMNLIDIFEMLCDWMAAISYGLNGNLAKSIKVNSERFNLSPQMRRVIENTAEWLKAESQAERRKAEGTDDDHQTETQTPNP